MDYFIDHWNALKESWRDKYLFLFLDYDGTLTPIVEIPDQSFLSAENKVLLQEMSGLPFCRLIIVSGRAVADIKKRVGIADIVYIGNHGFEIDSPQIHFENPDKDRITRLFQGIKNDLDRELTKIHGVIIEDKGWSIGVHYRMVPENNLGLFNTIFHHICKPYLVKKEISIQTGKKVFEISPPVKWDKGSIVKWFLNGQRFTLDNKATLPVYIGDDQTDEDAFQALKDEGITICVGHSEVSQAKYFLKDIKEVSLLLEEILELKTVESWE